MLPLVLSPNWWTWNPCCPGVNPLISPDNVTGVPGAYNKQIIFQSKFLFYSSFLLSFYMYLINFCVKIYINAIHTHLFTTEKFFYQPIGHHPHQILDPLRDQAKQYWPQHQFSTSAYFHSCFFFCVLIRLWQFCPKIFHKHLLLYY